MCIFVSETYELIDASFYDKGTDTEYNTGWSNPSNNTTVTRSSTETTLIQTTSGTTGFYQTNIVDNPLPNQCTIEFDVNLSSTGEVMSFRADSTVVNWITLSEYSLAADTWHHFKFEINGTTVKPTINNVAKSTETWTNTVNRFAFRLNSQELTIKYKNFVVY